MGGDKKKTPPRGRGAEQTKMKKIFVQLLDDEGLDVHQGGAGKEHADYQNGLFHGCTLFKKVIFVTTYRSMFDGGPYIAEQIPL